MIAFKENFKITPEKKLVYEGVIEKYLQYLISKGDDLDAILFYMRYLTDQSIFKSLFTNIFKKANGETQIKKASNTLQTYAQQDYQGIISQIIIEVSDLKQINIQPENILGFLKNQPNDNQVSSLIQSIIDPITKESLHNVLILIRKLVLSCRIEYANLLWIKCNLSLKNNMQNLEFMYWGKFFDVCTLYLKFYECKNADFYEEIERNSIRNVANSLITPHRLDINPVIAEEKKNEKCKQLALRIKPLLVDITGVIIYEFPLESIQFIEISKFKET